MRNVLYIVVLVRPLEIMLNEVPYAVAVTSNLLKALPFSSVSLNLQFTTLRQECLTVATYTI